MANFEYPNTQLLIDGHWRNAKKGKTIAIIDPANEEEIGTVAQADKQDLEAAAQSVKEGFAIWSQMPAFERAEIMRNAAALLRARVDTISWIMTREQGKPLSESRTEILNAADTIEWFSEEARRAYGHIIPPRSAHVTQMVIKHPIGPVAAFTPWNFPINQVVRKLAAALAAGCSVLVKAPEDTPASPAALLQCFLDADIPSSTIALVCGVPAEISEFLIPHPAIEKIPFTGSTIVGKQLAALAGQYMKKSTMELGGHAPVLIFDDADIDQAVKVMVASKFRNCGQVCIAPTRFMIHEKIYDEYVEKFIAAAQNLKIGNGLKSDTQLGPLINERRIVAVEKMVNDAVSHGAKIGLGGKRIHTKGYFFEPTVLTHVPIQADIMNEEPFGPVAILNRFKTLDQALEEANRLRYGLASYAFTQTPKTLHALSQHLNAGMTTINHNGISIPETPFGGIKDSGYGTEGGSEAINDYFYQKFVTIAS